MATNSLDLLFLLDVTGSMGRVITTIKERIREIVTEVKNAEEGARCVRLGLVGYRDYDDAGGVEVLEFTESVSDFERFLGALEARGGDDTAEDVLSGLEKAATMNWSSDARQVVHFADAPCHGSAYHDARVGDNWPEGDKHGRQSEKLLTDLVFAGVHTYQFMHLNPSTKKMLEEWRKEVSHVAPVADWFVEKDLDLGDGGLMMSHDVVLGSMISATRSSAAWMPVTPGVSKG